MERYPKVAVVYLAFHPDIYIDQFIKALKKITYPKESLEIIIVENSHPHYGLSYKHIEEKIVSLSGQELAHVTYLPQLQNLGFSGGVNKGIQWAQDQGFDYVYLHNQDGFMDAECLEKLVEVMEQDSSIGAAQSLILLYPATQKINSSGNSLHYLGFGFSAELNRTASGLEMPVVSEIGYASGAAVMLRVEVLKIYGYWDEDYFFYHEDIEYSLRLKSLGYKIVSVKNALFYHQYEFSRNKDKYYFMERNRWGLVLTFFKWPSLLLFLPLALFWEMGILFFALRQGWVKEKLRAYNYWLSVKHLQLWFKKRKLIQQSRTVSDIHLLKSMVGKVVFDDKAVQNKLLMYIGNPLTNAYFFIIKKLIFW